MAALPAAERVQHELLATLRVKAKTGALEEIRAETSDASFKWVYP